MSVFYSRRKKRTMEILEQFCHSNTVKWVSVCLSTSVAKSDKVLSWSEDVCVRIAVTHLRHVQDRRGQPTAPKDAEQINRIYLVAVKVQGDEIPVAVACSPIEENTRSFHGQILRRYVLEVNKIKMNMSNTFVVDETSSTVDSCSLLTFLRKLSLPCSLLTDFPNLAQKAWVTEGNTTAGTRR